MNNREILIDGDNFECFGGKPFLRGYDNSRDILISGDHQREMTLASSAIGLNMLHNLSQNGKAEEVSNLVRTIGIEAQKLGYGLNELTSGGESVFGGPLNVEITALAGVAAVSGMLDAVLSTKQGNVGSVGEFLGQFIGSSVVETIQMGIPYAGVWAATNVWQPTTDLESVARMCLVGAGLTSIVLGAIPDKAFVARGKIADWTEIAFQSVLLEAAEHIPPLVARIIRGRGE